METPTHNHGNGKGRRATIGRLVLIGFALVGSPLFIYPGNVGQPLPNGNF